MHIQGRWNFFILMNKPSGLVTCNVVSVVKHHTMETTEEINLHSYITETLLADDT